MAKRKKAARSQDPEGVRRDIVEVATEEFVRLGYSGARVDAIAALTRTSKRMIYYYFKNKEGLYVAVLEQAYRNIRDVEATLDLAHLPPEAALRRLVEFTFDYQNAHPDFIRLVMIENIHHARHIRRSRAIQSVNTTVIEAIERLYARGRAARQFRPGLDAIDLHMTISALCFFNVANRATFSTIFKRDMTSPKALAKRRAEVADIVWRYVRL
jgi:AcrR family transcriptional regulator